MDEEDIERTLSIESASYKWNLEQYDNVCQEVAFRFLGFIIFIHGIWLKREMRDNIKLYFSGILDIQVSTVISLKWCEWKVKMIKCGKVSTEIWILEQEISERVVS